MQEIVFKNFSTVLTDAQVAAIIPALQTQCDRDFCPVWKCGAVRLRFAAKTEKLSATAWLMGIYDDADQAGALGYHDVTANGTPLGKVFAKTTIDDGGSWTVTVSHELLEILADPWIVSCVIDDSSNRVFALEVCDAVEADELGYKIGGVQLSDFVLPGFFESGVHKGHSLSFCGHVRKPFELAAGGYLSFLDLSDPSQGWQQETARKRPGTSRGATRKAVREAGGVRRLSLGE